MPEFEIAEICPPVFKPIDIEKDIYKVYCRCAAYDINNSEFLTDFLPAPIEMCNKSYAFTAEYFLEKFEPTMIEISQWDSDIRKKAKKARKIFKKIKKVKDIDELQKILKTL